MKVIYKIYRLYTKYKNYNYIIFNNKLNLYMKKLIFLNKNTRSLDLFFGYKIIEIFWEVNINSYEKNHEMECYLNKYNKYVNWIFDTIKGLSI